MSSSSPSGLSYESKAVPTIVKAPALEEYMEKHSIHPSQAQDGLHNEVLAHRFGGMSSSRTESHFLAWLVRTLKAEKVIEVGVFLGATTLAIAQALPNNGKIIALDVNAEFAAVGQKYWKQAGVDNKIDLRIKPAVESLQELIAIQSELNSYDIVFIDADKHNYDNYYELTLQLLKVGGVLVIDNTFWGGSVLNDADTSKDTVAIRQLNEKVHGDKRVEASMIPLADGVTLCRKL